MKLYEIQKEIDEIYTHIEVSGGEILPEHEAKLDALEVAKEEKVEAILALRQDALLEAEKYNSEARRLAELAKKEERKAKSLESYLMHCVGEDHRQQTKLGKFSWKETIRAETTPDSLESIPLQYRKVRETWTPDKKAAKASWLATGEQIPGFTFSKHFHVSLR